MMASSTFSFYIAVCGTGNVAITRSYNNLFHLSIKDQRCNMNKLLSYIRYLSQGNESMMAVLLPYQGLVFLLTEGTLILGPLIWPSPLQYWIISTSKFHSVVLIHALSQEP